MANLDFMSAGQAQKEVTFNNLVKALETNLIYTIKESMSNGLSLYVIGGILLGDGVNINVVDTTLTLVASTTNYVEANSTTGVISVNQTGFTVGAISLFQIATNAVTRTSTVNKKPNPLRASSYSLPEATDVVLGGVKLGTGLEKVDGKTNVKIDGTTIVLNESGQLKAVSSGGGGSGGTGLTLFKETKYDAAPHTTIPLYAFELIDSAPNADVFLGRGGNGSYIFFSNGANKVGRNSADFTSARSAATQIVSGNSSGGGGQNVTISKDWCFGWGYNLSISGNYSAGFGTGNTVSGASSFASGDGNSASGTASFASGTDNTVSGSYSSSNGYKNQTTGSGSFTYGNRSINNVDYSLLGGEGGNTHGIASDLTFGARWDTNSANAAKGSSQFRTHRYKTRINSASVLSKVMNEVRSTDTTGATAVNQLSLVANQVKFFKGVVVMCEENQSAIAVFEIEGLIKRPGAASTVELVSSTITPKFADATATANGFSVSLSANTTLGCLSITCSTTTYTKTIYCQARLNVDEMICAY